MRSIREAVPGARCLIVGDGPCRADLERLATRLGLEGAVTFAGARAEGAALIPLFDVAVLPSLREGLSLFLLEAMVAGKPVVASRVGGIPEVVSDGKTGLLVPAGDEARLAAAIIILLRHAYIRRRMGEAARLRMQESFSPEEMLDRVLALYHGAPQGSGVPGAQPGPRALGRPALARAAAGEAPVVRGA
jgi:glycosyltransferase involved in cell wall biosynthesis